MRPSPHVEPTRLAHVFGPNVRIDIVTLRASEKYQRGIRHFNAREFYDAHEVWEDVWRESHGMEKRFLQGLIQAAVALHHHSTGNVVGACSLMERARRNLAGCPAEFGGFGWRSCWRRWASGGRRWLSGEASPERPVIAVAE